MTYDPRESEAIGNQIEGLLIKSERTFYLVELLEIKDDLLQQAQNYYDLTGTHYCIAGSQETLFRLANLSPLETYTPQTKQTVQIGRGDDLCGNLNESGGSTAVKTGETTQNKFYDEPHEVCGFGD